MTKIVFACPQCSQRLRADADRAHEQFTCPGCDNVFVPDADCQSAQGGPESEITRQAEKLEAAADSLRQIAFVAVCALLLCIGGAVFARIQDSAAWLPWCWGASAAVAVSILLWFAGQLLAIRANGLRVLDELRTHNSQTINASSP